MASIQKLRENIETRTSAMEALQLEQTELSPRTKRYKELSAEIEVLARLIAKNQGTLDKKLAEDTSASVETRAAKPAAFNARNAAIAAAIANNSKVETVGETDEAPKRRGRPRKNASEPVVSEPVVEAPKRRGRPRKNASEPVVATIANRIPEGKTLGDMFEKVETPETDSPATSNAPTVNYVNVRADVARMEPSELSAILTPEQIQYVFRGELERRKAENRARTLENPIIVRKHKAQGRLELERQIATLVSYVSNLSVIETREFVDSDGELHTYEKKIRPVNMHSTLDIAEMVQGPAKIATAPQMLELADMCKSVTSTVTKFRKAEDNAYQE
jgi:hypothetical protein